MAMFFFSIDVQKLIRVVLWNGTRKLEVERKEQEASRVCGLMGQQSVPQSPTTPSKSLWLTRLVKISNFPSADIIKNLLIKWMMQITVWYYIICARSVFRTPPPIFLINQIDFAIISKTFDCFWAVWTSLILFRRTNFWDLEKMELSKKILNSEANMRNLWKISQYFVIYSWVRFSVLKMAILELHAQNTMLALFVCYWIPLKIFSYLF